MAKDVFIHKQNKLVSDTAPSFVTLFRYLWHMWHYSAICDMWHFHHLWHNYKTLFRHLWHCDTIVTLFHHLWHNYAIYNTILSFMKYMTLFRHLWHTCHYFALYDIRDTISQFMTYVTLFCNLWHSWHYSAICDICDTIPPFVTLFQEFTIFHYSDILLHNFVTLLRHLWH